MKLFPSIIFSIPVSNKKARHERRPLGHPIPFPVSTTQRSTHDELFLCVDLMIIPVLAAALDRGSRGYLRLIIRVATQNTKYEKQGSRIVVENVNEYKYVFITQVACTASQEVRGDVIEYL